MLNFWLCYSPLVGLHTSCSFHRRLTMLWHVCQLIHKAVPVMLPEAAEQPRPPPADNPPSACQHVTCTWEVYHLGLPSSGLSDPALVSVSLWVENLGLFLDHAVGFFLEEVWEAEFKFSQSVSSCKLHIHAMSKKKKTFAALINMSTPGSENGLSLSPLFLFQHTLYGGDDYFINQQFRRLLDQEFNQSEAQLSLLTCWLNQTNDVMETTSIFHTVYGLHVSLLQIIVSLSWEMFWCS